MWKSGIDSLLTTRGVVVFWLASALAFVAMLWAVAPGRTLQDALSAEMLQGHLAGGYQLRNPPLYEWLLWGIQQIAGPGPLSYLVLRYALIAAAGILFYFAAQRTTEDAKLAAAFSLSLVLLFWFGWDAHHSISHSLAIVVASLALWVTTFVYADRLGLARAFAVGLVIGLGIMAKWSFLVVVASLGIAFALTPSARSQFFRPQALAILAGAALPVIPFAVWFAAMEPAIVHQRVALMQPEGAAARTLVGARKFVIGIFLVLLPWLLVVLPLAFRFRREGEERASAADATRIALLTAGIAVTGLALSLGTATLLGLRPFGIRTFLIHYLYPFCLFAALGIAGLLAARVNGARFARILAGISVVAALDLFAIKLASFYVVPEVAPATQLLPYARLAEALEARGLGAAQFVTLSPRDAGNLAVYLPEARALSPSARVEPPPPDPMSGRICVLLWGGETSVPPALPRASSPTRLLHALGVKAPGRRR
jgi:hypothetical protein